MGVAQRLVPSQSKIGRGRGGAGVNGDGENHWSADFKRVSRSVSPGVAPCFPQSAAYGQGFNSIRALR